MVKMKERNGQLKSNLGAMAPKQRVIAANSIPKEDTVNRQGHAAYSLDDELRLISMLNTLKLEPQFYRSEGQTMKELRDLIERLALRDPYFVAQAIVYSRCLGEGMRSINHLAAALLAPFISGEEYAKRFYGLWDKKNQRGGCIFRVDDMSEIKDVYSALNKSTLSNSMKKGFAKVLESLDTYQMAKYKGTVVDIANLVHPKSSLSTAMVEVNGEKMRTLDALMKGITVSADTWEVAQSEAGQEVAKAVKAGKLTKEEGEKVLAEAKADNWESLLREGKLGVLAALRNIRNILKNPRKEIVDNWCTLIRDAEKVRKALILPIHFDLAYDVVDNEFGQNIYANQVRQALHDGYVAAIPNLAKVLTGKTLVIVDRSGSMDSGICHEGDRNRQYYGSPQTQRACYKAGLIAATICSATGADVVKFGSSAEFFHYDKNLNVFALAKQIGTASCDSTNPAAAFDLIRRARKAYDRIIFISDNEVNGRLTSAAYRGYVHDVADPYVYGIDLCAYGTTPLKRDGKVQYFFGYGPSLYESIASSEFNPMEHLEKVRKIVI